MLLMMEEQVRRDHRVPLTPIPLRTLVGPRSIWNNANFVGTGSEVGTMHPDRRYRRRPEATSFGNLLSRITFFRKPHHTG